MAPQRCARPGRAGFPTPSRSRAPSSTCPSSAPNRSRPRGSPHRHPADAPAVRVVERDDVLYTLDDRRRYASKQAGVEDIADPRSEL